MGVSSIECRRAHSCFDGTERVHVETGFGARSSFEGSADFLCFYFSEVRNSKRASCLIGGPWRAGDDGSSKKAAQVHHRQVAFCR